jgi:hypothetical protein
VTNLLKSFEVDLESIFSAIAQAVNCKPWEEEKINENMDKLKKKAEDFIAECKDFESFYEIYSKLMF